MSLTRTVAHNTLWQAAGRTISIALVTLVFFMVARHLGVEGYGQYATVTAFLQFFGIAVDLGLYIYLSKTLGEPGTDQIRTVSSVFTLRLISAAVIIGIAPLVVWFFPYPTVVKLGIAAMSLSAFFVTITQVLAGVFQKALKAQQFMYGEVVGRVLLVVITFLAIRAGVGVVGIVWTVVISSAVIFWLTLVWARRLVPFRLQLDLTAWKQILRTTWPIALSITFNVIYFKANLVILSLFKPAYDVGIYAAPYRVFEALISIPALFAGLLTPLLTTAFVTDRQRFGRMLQRGFETLLLAVAPMVVGAQFVADGLMQLVAPGFAPSAPVLRILVFATAAIFIGYLFSNTVVVVNRQRTMVWVYAVMAVTSVGLYLWLIPKFSYFGAAVVTVLIEAAVAAANAWVVIRASGARFTLGVSSRILLAAGVMAGVMWFGRGLPWVANGTLGVVAYVIACLGLRAIDRTTLQEVFRRTA